MELLCGATAAADSIDARRCVGVFNQVIRELGAEGFQVEELYGLDCEALRRDYQPLYGLIFLFRWDGALERTGKAAWPSQEEVDEALAIAMSCDVFFARQTVNNACATQAILSILLNTPVAKGQGDAPDSTTEGKAAKPKLGDSLRAFRDFAMELSPEMRGEAIGANELFRRVHNSFARPEHAYLDEESRKRRRSSQRGAKEEEPFHFIGIAPVGGNLYEFDGLKEAPICHGAVSDAAPWEEMALRVVQEKIGLIQAAGATDEIRFSLMAVIGDRIGRLQEQIRENAAEMDRLQGEGNVDALVAANEQLADQLEEEASKRADQECENSRRRHNFMPLAMAILQELACARRSDPPPEEKMISSPG